MLFDLPNEILLEIARYLPVSALVSLKLTSRRLYYAIPIPLKFRFGESSMCERLAIRRNLNERKDLRDKRRRCLGCNTLQSTNHFRHQSRICTWEDGLLMALAVPPYVEDPTRRRLRILAKRIKQPRWIAISRVLCTHNRDISSWSVPACNCRCESCAHVEVTCYVRVARKLVIPASWRLCDDQYGQFVLEESWCTGM